jgi:HAD superfamily hydrolase (TIGR01450 family)
VPGAVEGIAGLEQRRVPLMYVTNNAARARQTVVDHLNSLGFPATAKQVLTSAMVAAEYLKKELPAGARILIAGSQNLAQVIAQAGFTPVHSADDSPVAVLQGYDPELRWPVLDEACLAIERGAAWYSCNDDSNRPTDRGTVPGVGGMIAVLQTALGGTPKTFGKPFRPMMDEAARLTGARRPIFVGDRLDTDIEGAHNAGFDSLLVFTGVHGKRDLVQAAPAFRPTHIGADIRALLAPARAVEVGEAYAVCGGGRAELRAGEAVLARCEAETAAGQLDALWALAHLVWEHPGTDAEGALESLALLR